jgi:Plasmid pRiA4b ORF-3-like protein
MSERFYQLKIELAWIEPTIWRRFIVPEDITLDRLHDVIQIVMSWMESHLHEFNIGGKRYTENPESPEDNLEESPVRLNDVITKAGMEFSYVYDFGDDWMHKITVEKIMKTQPKNVNQIIWCIEGKRNCPPEDVGGPHGYEMFCKAIKYKKHPEHESYKRWYSETEWYPEEFDPESFNQNNVNLELSKYLRWSRPRTHSIEISLN